MPLYAEGFDQVVGSIPNGELVEGDYWFVDEYVRALDEGRPHECSGAEGRHVVEIIAGIFESAAYGKRVDLPQADRQHPLLRWRRSRIGRSRTYADDRCRVVGRKKRNA